MFRIQGLGLGWVKFRVIKTPLSGVHVSVRVTYMCLLVFLPIHLVHVSVPVHVSPVSPCACTCVYVSVCVSVCSASQRVRRRARAGERGRESLFGVELEGERVRLREREKEERTRRRMLVVLFSDVGLSWATVPAICRGLPVQAWVCHVASQALPPLVRT